MKVKNIIRYVLVVALFVVSSCSKETKLNPQPTTLISDAAAFASADRIANQINGLYATFKQSAFWGAGYIRYSEARAGDFVESTLNPTRGGLSYQMEVNSGTDEVNSVWQAGFLAINGCNVFIDGMDNGGSEIVGVDLSNNYIAEARFIRAISYYFLLQLYAHPYTKDNGASPGLPLRLSPNKGLSDYNQSRASVSDVYNQIIDDLNFAEANLPDSYATPLLNTTRAHKNTAIAAKVKVYLSMGNYPSVITEANKIVPVNQPYTASSGVAIGLVSNIVSVFKAPYSSAESIFSMPFSSTDGGSLANSYLPDGLNATGFSAAGTGDYYLLENAIVSDPNWLSSDQRRQLIFTTQAGQNIGRQWCVKYSTGSPYTDYLPVIRYAEVMLSLAEALANENGLDSRAVDLLNAIRHRSDPTTTFAPAGKQELIDDIVHERHIEFVGEGIRNADLMRLKLAVPAKNPKGSSPVPEITPDNPKYIWPIPVSESLYNDDI